MKHQVLSQKKLFMMLAIELFAMTSLILPGVIVGFAGVNGIPFLLSGSGLLFLLALGYLKCLKRFNNPLDQMLEREKNVVLRNGIRGIYAVRYFLHGLFLTVLFLDLIQEVLLPDYSPVEILLPVSVLLFFMSGKNGIVRGRIAETLFPYIFLPLVLVLVISLSKLEYASLPNQLWGTFIRDGFSGLRDSLYGIYGIFLFYQPIEFILFQLPLSTSRTVSEEEVRKGHLLGLTCLGVVFINVLLYVVTIGTIGVERTGEKLWSALYVMQSVRLPGKFFERLDILFLVFWIFGTVYLISSYVYYGCRILGAENGDEAEEKRIRYYVWGWILTLCLSASIIKEPRVIFEFFIPYKMWIDFPLGLLLPFFLYRRKKKGHTHNRKNREITMAVILCTVLLTGCQNRADIEDKNYIMSIGVEEGETKAFLFHYEIADLTKGNQESDGRTSRILSYEADSLEEAESLNRLSEDKRLDYGHLKVILFEKEVMKPGEKREKMIEGLKEKNSIGATALLFFTNQVTAVMEKGGEKGTSFGEYMNQMVVNQRILAGKEDTFADLLKDEAEEKGDRPIYVLEAKEEGILLQKEILRGGGSELSNLAGELVRFHIRAHSNSSYDQQKKIAVKNRILPKLQELLKAAESKESCMDILNESIPLIEQWVQDACDAEAYSCECQTYICRENFPLKIYGDVAIPGGVYDALRIDLGAADGKNWWCMMYPSLCLSEGVIEKVSEDGKEVLEEELTEEEYEEISMKQEGSRYHIRWKILEVIKKLWLRENLS